MPRDVRKGNVRYGYANSAVGQIHYRELGRGGEPLILLHKSPSSSVMYMTLMPLLAEAGYWAIAMDTPGFGLSDQLRERPTSLDPYHQGVIDLMDALGISRASFVGHATGASIALEVAGRDPERVDKLIIASCGACENEADRRAALAALRTAVNPVLWPEGVSAGESVAIDARGDFLVHYPLTNLRSGKFTSGDAERFNAELIAYLQALPEYPVWVAEVVFTPPGAYAYFPTMRCSTLVVNAVGQSIYQLTKKAAAAIKGGLYVEVPGTAEFISADPARFADIAIHFLRTGRIEEAQEQR